MRFRYQATYDAGLDTFRIEYLLVGSAIMGIISAYIYTVVEVKKKIWWFGNGQVVSNVIGIMDFFYLVGGRGNFTTIVHAAANWGSRDNYNTLLICSGRLPSIVFVKLDL